jgi:hypothetical protein
MACRTLPPRAAWPGRTTRPPFPDTRPAALDHEPKQAMASAYLAKETRQEDTAELASRSALGQAHPKDPCKGTPGAPYAAGGTATGVAHRCQRVVVAIATRHLLARGPSGRFPRMYRWWGSVAIVVVSQTNGGLEQFTVACSTSRGGQSCPPRFARGLRRGGGHIPPPPNMPPPRR